MNITSKYTAVVHFRTLPNGSFEYMRGLRRGYWRVLVVKDPMGCLSVSSHNVVEVLWTGESGIQGVGPRSRYYIRPSYDSACRVAEHYNSQIEVMT